MRYLLLLLSACAAGEGGTPDACADAATLAWANYGDGFFTEYCQGCHASGAGERFGAPQDVVFDEEADVLDQFDVIRREVLDEQTMPPGGGVPDDELALLRQYLDCSGG